ncbi:hypothetical protein CPB84DRAFT_207899 [Gymnopilus junonius]|uniref:Uncharacterized protein n=1 Tax=Gymnopilus junonius TaxID=109634 RepID=A0A9P5TR95_GYMJU|nr:hypothetical protein CPB84DRAFT_207899 [Gymnopilus junonius]
MASLLRLMNPLKTNNRAIAGQVNIIIPDKDDDGNVPTDYYTLNKYSAAVLFEVFLYGIYSTLFAICIRVQLRNKRSTQKILMACA